MSPWRLVWESAAQTFHTTIRALAASRLPLEKLDVFNNRQLQSCSIASDELCRMDFLNKGLAISLSSLKSATDKGAIVGVFSIYCKV
jgi:hypothetical protein